MSARSTTMPPRRSCASSPASSRWRRVRKARGIARLLVWQFTRPVVIANIIAWPVAWWLMREFLNAFDARISLTPVPFIGASLLALAIAVLTIGAHAFRVARTNPIHALRYE